MIIGIISWIFFMLDRIIMKCIIIINIIIKKICRPGCVSLQHLKYFMIILFSQWFSSLDVALAYVAIWLIYQLIVPYLLCVAEISDWLDACGHVKRRPWRIASSPHSFSTLTEPEPPLIHTWCICSLRVKWHLYIIVEIGDEKKREMSVSTIFKWSPPHTTLSSTCQLRWW